MLLAIQFSLLSASGAKTNLDSFQKLNHVMMAMAQLLNIQMPGSYELSFPPQNPDMPGFDGPGKGPGQSGTHLESCCLLAHSNSVKVLLTFTSLFADLIKFNHYLMLHAARTL